MGILRQAFKLAYRAEKVYRVPAFPKIKLDNARTEFFDDAEFEALRAELPDYLKNVFEFAYWTGWRGKSEVLTRQWRHVDFDAGVIRLEPGETKNGRGRTFPFDIIPELKTVLEQQRAYTDKIEKQTGQIVPWVFHHNGKRVKEFQSARWGACARVGFAVPRTDADGNVVRDDKGKPVMVPTKRPHDFRRTAVRRLERAGVSRSVAMQLVGHQTETMYQRYAITCETDLREGLEKVHAMHEMGEKKVLPFRTGTNT